MKKVLIVDDQANIRTMIRLALRNRFSLDEALNADAAYEHILTDRPDAIVLDVIMPGKINGLQLCERIKKDEKLASIHVVMVTACGQVEDQELGRALGANAYFVKPFSLLALEQHLITNLLAAPSARAESSIL